MAQTSKEKSALRKESMDRIAMEFSERIPEFKEFAENKCSGEITWRKFETFLKKRFGLSDIPGEYKRNSALNQIAEQFAQVHPGFRYYLIIKGDPESNSEPPTWRRMETFIKQKSAENGVVDDVVKFVLESSASGN